MIGDAAQKSASHACGSTPLSFAVAIRVYIAAARSPPRSEPANSHARGRCDADDCRAGRGRDRRLYDENYAGLARELDHVRLRQVQGAF
jgi:hypothetical protein